MGVNSAHPDYDGAAAEWSRARDVLADEDAVKAAGDKYLPKLESQTEEEYAAYKVRASFFGGAARTLEEYLDLIFRRTPALAYGSGEALKTFASDCAHSSPPYIRAIREIRGWPPPSFVSLCRNPGFKLPVSSLYTVFGLRISPLPIYQRGSAWISVSPLRPKNPDFRPHFFLNKNTFPLRSFPARTTLKFLHEKK